MPGFMSVQVNYQFAHIECDQCGIHFYVPNDWDGNRRRDGGLIYCPNGHSMSYGESTKAKLKKAQEQLRFAQSRLQSEQYNHKITKQELKAKREGMRKIKARVFNGVCPCCKRHFDDLQSHMASKHPKFAADSRPKNVRRRDEADAKIVAELNGEWQEAKEVAKRLGQPVQSITPMLSRMVLEGVVERRYEGYKTLWRRGV